MEKYMKNGLFLYLENKNGFLLPYTFLTCMIVLNIVIFVVLCNLNTKNYYEDVDNYYHMILLEQRAKRILKAEIKKGNVQKSYTIKIIEDDYRIYFTFTSVTTAKYELSFEFYYQKLFEYGIIYYDTTTESIEIIYR